MKILLICMMINLLFTQANYQILTTPSNFQDIFKINVNYEGIENNNQFYSIFNSSFPDDINLFSLTASSLKKTESDYQFFITLKNLDYGEIIDNENDYQFTANESIIKFGILNHKYSLQGIKTIRLNMSYLTSSIDSFNSDAICFDLIADISLPDFYGWSNSFDIQFKNFGKILNSYSNADINLPEMITASYTIYPLPTTSLRLHYEDRLDLAESVMHYILRIKLNQNLDLYVSNRSNRSDLFYDDYIQELTAGTNMGLSYKKNNNVFNLAIQELGAAGYCTSVSFSKVIL